MGLGPMVVDRNVTFVMQKNGLFVSIDEATGVHTVTLNDMQAVESCSDLKRAVAEDELWAVCSYKSIFRISLTSFAAALYYESLTSATLDGLIQVATFLSMRSLVFIGAQTLLLTDKYAIRQLDLGTTQIRTLAGGRTPGDIDGPAGAATFMAICGMAHDASNGWSFVIQCNGAVRKLVNSGGYQVVTVAVTCDYPTSVETTFYSAVLEDGSLFLGHDTQLQLMSWEGGTQAVGLAWQGNDDGGPLAATFAMIVGIAYNTVTKRAFVAQANSMRVRFVEFSSKPASVRYGVARVVAGNPTQWPYGSGGIASSDSFLSIAVASNGTVYAMREAFLVVVQPTGGAIQVGSDWCPASKQAIALGLGEAVLYAVCYAKMAMYAITCQGYCTAPTFTLVYGDEGKWSSPIVTPLYIAYQPSRRLIFIYDENPKKVVGVDEATMTLYATYYTASASGMAVDDAHDMLYLCSPTSDLIIKISIATRTVLYTISINPRYVSWSANPAGLAAFGGVLVALLPGPKSVVVYEEPDIVRYVVGPGIANPPTASLALLQLVNPTGIAVGKNGTLYILTDKCIFSAAPVDWVAPNLTLAPPTKLTTLTHTGGLSTTRLTKVASKSSTTTLERDFETPSFTATYATTIRENTDTQLHSLTLLHAAGTPSSTHSAPTRPTPSRTLRLLSTPFINPISQITSEEVARATVATGTSMAALAGFAATASMGHATRMGALMLSVQCAFAAGELGPPSLVELPLQWSIESQGGSLGWHAGSALLTSALLVGAATIVVRRCARHFVILWSV